MKKYECEPCGYIYDPAVGDPDGGIAPGTAFEDIPDDWVCPICGLGKDVFLPFRFRQEKFFHLFFLSEYITPARFPCRQMHYSEALKL